MANKTCPICKTIFIATSNAQRFCSHSCKLAHRRKQDEKTCPECGLVGFRDFDLCRVCRKTLLPFQVCPECGHESYRRLAYCREHDPERVRWTEAEDSIVQMHYASLGASPLMPMLPEHTYTQIRDRAYHLGVIMDKATYRQVVHDQAAAYMREHNPSHLPGASARLRKRSKQMWKNRPDVVQKILDGARNFQMGTPTKLELKLFSILDELQVDYEQYAIIKPKFIVDVRIRDLIIQADGDWWHGHPRFDPPNERQIKQQKRDRAQDKYLAKCGYAVERIWESDMVLEIVWSALVRYSIL